VHSRQGCWSTVIHLLDDGSSPRYGLRNLNLTRAQGIADIDLASVLRHASGGLRASSGVLRTLEG